MSMLMANPPKVKLPRFQRCVCCLINFLIASKSELLIDSYSFGLNSKYLNSLFRSYDVEEKLNPNSTDNNGSKKGHDVSKVVKTN